jgi:hypothetical protein
MLVRFWGTRGSLPVALTATTVQAKIAKALVAAGGRELARRAALWRCDLGCAKLG